jgi:plastocyanin
MVLCALGAGCGPSAVSRGANLPTFQSSAAPAIQRVPTAGDTPQVWVGNSDNSVTMYYETDSGNTPPRVTIAGSNTGIGEPSGISVDQSGNVYVSNYYPQQTVTEFAAGSNGNVAPIRTISCGGFSQPRGNTVDQLGNLYVAGGNAVAIIPPGLSGCVVGNPVITGPATQLDAPTDVAVGPYGRIYVSNFGSAPRYRGRVTVYAPGSSGNVAPLFVSVPGPSQPEAIAMGSDGSVFVSGQLGEIDVFRPQLQHEIRSFSAPDGNTDAIGVTVDGREWTILGCGYHNICEYAAGATGAPNPINVITSTGISPFTMALFEQQQTVGVRLTNEQPANDPTYGFILGYANGGNSKQSAVVGLTAGDPVQFVNADTTLTHTASFLGDATQYNAPWPSSFNGSSMKSPAGTSIASPGFSTGPLAPGKVSAMYSSGPPGFYMIGCAFHYNSNEMRTIVIVH